MNINEIIKALRGTCDQCNPTPCCEFEVLGDEAAKLIEMLQLRLVELESKLSAAVDDLKHSEHDNGKCDYCRHRTEDGDCTSMPVPYSSCSKVNRWEWRGTKYTEEGVKE